MAVQRLILTYRSQLNCLLPVKVSLYRVLVFLILVAFACLLFYLFQVEKLISSNYALKNYAKEFNQLKEDNLAFQEQYSHLSSLFNTEKEIASLGFVETGNIKYIPIFDDYLARVEN
jgi:hypothetical protein